MRKLTKSDRAAVERLIETMTVTEKVGQLSQRAVGETFALGLDVNHTVEERIRAGMIGAVIHYAVDMSATTRRLQEIAVHESPHGIPILFNADVIHGFETVFPIPLAASCSFDTDLVEETARIAATEAGSCGIHYTNAPMVDICRDPRWGRIVEGSGEDPFLTAEMGKAYIRGFQNGPKPILATLKHYAAYGFCEGGRDYNNAEVCEHTVRNTVLMPFEEGIKAGCASVMTAFNTIEGVPATASQKYLQTILRRELGFSGIVISDAMAVEELIAHGVAADKREAALLAFKAGVDLEMGTDCYELHLPQLLAEGLITGEELNASVRRILTKKFEFNLFDAPFASFEKPAGFVNFSGESLALSQRLAEESIVLLENDGSLPLGKDKRVALIGNYADSRAVLGCWQFSVRTQEVKTLCEVLQENGIKFAKHAGFEPEGIDEAANDADIVLFAVGMEETGEAYSKWDIGLKPYMRSAFDRLCAAGKKVVMLVYSERPLLMEHYRGKAAAVLWCWHLGHRTNEAVVNVLTGAAVPSGKLTVSFPYCEGQIPVYYNYYSTGRPVHRDDPGRTYVSTYRDGTDLPLYPFGYGLSYTQFDYSDLKAGSTVFDIRQGLTVSVQVTNTGAWDGTEIVQLYIRDRVGETARPVKELKGFKRVFLKRGERQTVTFNLTGGHFEYYHSTGKKLADPGQFVIYAGGSSMTNCCIEVTGQLPSIQESP